MKLKIFTLITTLGTTALLAGMAWLNQGCSMTSDECICTTEFRYQEAVVLDDLSQPVDSNYPLNGTGLRS